MRLPISITSEPIYRDSEDGLSRILVNDWVVLIGGMPILIPAGFVSDGASVPRFLWAIIPPYGRYTKAAIVHDFLYKTGLFTKAQADWIFLDMMDHCGVPTWKRNVMYAGVCSFGSSAWNHHRKVNAHV